MTNTKKRKYYGYQTFDAKGCFQDYGCGYGSEEGARTALVEYLKNHLTRNGQVFQCRVLSEVRIQTEVKVNKP